MRKYTPWLVAALALVLVLLVSTCSVSNMPFLPSALQSVSGSQSPAPVVVAGRTRGDPSAGATLVEYADFQ